MTTTTLNGENPSLVERVLAITRERILSGVYPPGSRLRLQMLAEESGASLIPVREALRVLEAERLVESIPNRGARVASLSLDDMQDLYNVRILLETESVRQAQQLEPEEEAELTALLDEMKKASASDDVERVLELHRRYHFALYGRTDSSWLPYLIGLLWKHTERYQRLSLAFRHDAADPEHRAVLEALALGDSDMAASALRSHLETTAKLVIEAYQAPEAEMATS